MNRLRLFKPAAVYFAIVFGVGFLLGPIRVLWLEPRVGVRVAELLESPLMLFAIVVTGHWVWRRLCAGYRPGSLLAVGLIAGALVLTADLAVGVGLRGMTIAQVFTDRDPVSGTVYYGLVGLLSLMPWFFGWRSALRASDPA